MSNVKTFHDSVLTAASGGTATPKLLPNGDQKPLEKPKAKDWTSHLSTESKTRKASPLKSSFKYLSNPGLISLGGGLPTPAYFPFESISAKVATVGKFSEEETLTSGTTMSVPKYDKSAGAYDLARALQYGSGSGSPELLEFLTQHTEMIHHPPYADWKCVMTAGNTSALATCYRMLMNRGDFLLMEEYTFPSAVETASPMGIKPLGVKIDGEGVIAEALDELLSNWDEAARGGRKPHVMYLIPTGQNPTGSTGSAERRKAVYAVCQKHDVIILEDEPYYFLQMQPYVRDAPPAPLPGSHEEFIADLIPSYLSLDTDGRVIRLDSFSKVIAPGSRCGWLTGPAQLMERALRHNEVSIQSASGFSQAILYQLLSQTWGHSGYLDWLINLRAEYTARRDICLKAMEEYLPEGICSWVNPAAGMFIWIEVDPSKHPQISEGLPVIEDRVFQKAIDKNVLVVPGSWFIVDEDAKYSKGKLFYRITFACVASELVVEALKRFGAAIKEEYGIAA
ncbi:L-kynurenine/alpha-aminoadipate aminotransferase [Saitoella complicata NRRL Y-17804]|uniref:aromatic-amino-acid transaminase n=1 Tax=Saitoella complicata (strain BCRC 22490 / CBS 7301 / JCM 7358 / NBRC 10748 / NRRL Y-17804) TaxID=698492 RepID=A0A0E9NLR4_SAICN|nr:L-kynurenine/alpha-aminoadipate aminotransferase [Saitoella complicata NRRL Y-17804]ODQ55487.1 L-kynurenine/alpha-aminoadipate aminotransferase [Saitoella complicata NRRL Y-17804]GAO50738.1 hypothetical protein G7K_4859-t1 [Saitoella complicata NRRL Y-17804]